MSCIKEYQKEPENASAQSFTLQTTYYSDDSFLFIAGLSKPHNFIKSACTKNEYEKKGKIKTDYKRIFCENGKLMTYTYKSIFLFFIFLIYKKMINVPRLN